MARLEGGIFGKVKGRVGNVIIQGSLGGTTVKTYNPNPKNPNTPGQKKQRDKHRGIVKYAKQINSILRVTLKSRAIKMSAYNAFYSLNVSRMDDTTGKIKVGEEDKIEFGKGPIQVLPGGGINTKTLSKVEIYWTKSGILNPQDLSNKVAWFAYNENQDFIHSGISSLDLSKDKFVTGTIGEAGHKVHVYAVVLDDVKLISSETSYLGTIALSA